MDFMNKISMYSRMSCRGLNAIQTTHFVSSFFELCGFPVGAIFDVYLGPLPIYFLVPRTGTGDVTMRKWNYLGNNPKLSMTTVK